jgi:hypothetical protein
MRFGKPVESTTTPISTDVADLIALLAGYDHDARKEAIELLAACRYQDPEDPRTYEALESAGRPAGDWDPDALQADLERFSDFSMAYTRAAQPNGVSNDYTNTNVSILLDGLVKAKTKGDILADLACYYLYSGKDRFRALDYATAAVLLGDPTEGPGSMVDVLSFLAEAFRRVGRKKVAELAMNVKAPYSLNFKEADYIATLAVPGLSVTAASEVKWAAKVLEPRLRSIRDRR